MTQQKGKPPTSKMPIAIPKQMAQHIRETALKEDRTLGMVIYRALKQVYPQIKEPKQ